MRDPFEDLRSARGGTHTPDIADVRRRATMLKRRKTVVVAGVLAALVPLTIGGASLLNGEGNGSGPDVVTSPSPTESPEFVEVPGPFRRGKVERKLAGLQEQLEQLRAQKREVRRELMEPGTDREERRDKARSMRRLERALREMERELTRTLMKGRRQEECSKLPLPFEATYLPAGFDAELRPGGASDGPGRKTDLPGSLGYYRSKKGGMGDYIDIMENGAPFWPSEPMAIPVGDRPGKIGRIEGGFSVRFMWSKCDYLMLSYSLSFDELRRVAEGLIARR